MCSKSDMFMMCSALTTPVSSHTGKCQNDTMPSFFLLHPSHRCPLPCFSLQVRAKPNHPHDTKCPDFSVPTSIGVECMYSLMCHPASSMTVRHASHYLRIVNVAISCPFISRNFVMHRNDKALLKQFKKCKPPR